MISVTPDDYLRFCEGLRQICGIDLTQYKRPQMERRLRSFLERRGFSRLSDSLARLREDKSELEALLDRMTINVSQLWRNPEQWTVVERRPARARRLKTSEAWSAGCSYGAEAYTLAAICRRPSRHASVKILGTDIDPRMVQRAKLGEFNDADARSAPTAAIERWFRRDG